MKTVRVNIQIQMDILGEDKKAEIEAILDTINHIISQSELGSQPQIFSDNIDNDDIVVDGYKSVHDLNENELEELRERYFGQLQEMDEDVLGDITDATEIPMDNIKAHYEETFFVEEDFFCNL